MIPIGSTFYDGRNSGSQQSDHIQLNTTIPAQAFPEDTSLDSKRRRIARACDMCRKKKVCHCAKFIIQAQFPILTDHTDQMRRTSTSVQSLYQLQDGMHFYIGGEEKKCTERCKVH
jgi:hypothetical protein